MTNIIDFTEIDGDRILEVIFDYPFSIGDTVYYEIPEKDRTAIAWFYNNADIEGVIVNKWIDLTSKIVRWQVDVDFVRCDI